MVRGSDLEPKDCGFDSQYPTGRKKSETHCFQCVCVCVCVHYC